MVRSASLLALASMVLGCGGSSEDAPSTSSDASVPLVSDSGACGVTTTRVPSASAVHVDQGSALTFASNPPCGGDHYPFWATWGVHPEAVPRGNWIHNLEHGGVVFLYRCADRAACPELAAKVEALVGTLPGESLCSAPVKNRAIVTADPLLPEGVQVAAVAWEHSLVARCVDDAALKNFYLARVGRAPENTCAEGSSLVAPPGDAGMETGNGKGKDGG